MIPWSWPGPCSLAGKMQLSDAAPQLSALLAHDSPKVRLAAVEAATELRASVGDRGLAVHPVRSGTGRSGSRPPGRSGSSGIGRRHPTFGRSSKERRSEQADISEQIAFFESYGMIQDPEGVRLLDGLLNGRGFLGRKETGEIRACAALGLGKMGTPEAAAALEKASAEPDPVVRSAVNRALEGRV